MSAWRAAWMAMAFVAAIFAWYAFIEGDNVSACVGFVVVAGCCAEGWRN